MQCTCAVSSFVAFPAVRFSTSCHKRHDLEKKASEHKVVFGVLYNFYLKHFFSFWEGISEIWSKIYVDLHVKYPFFSDFNDSWIFSPYFEKYSYQIWWKSVQWEPSSSMRTDGRTDLTTLIVALRNSPNAPKKDEVCQTVTILETTGVSADCGVVEFARCCAQCRVATNVCGHLSGVCLVHTAAWGVQLRCEPQGQVIPHLPSIAKD